MPSVYLFETIQFGDNTMASLSGGTISTFSAGTVTPLASYTDSTGTVIAANPVVCDSAGRAQLWLQGVAYKLVLKTSAGVALQTIDGFNPVGTTSSTVAGLIDTGDLTLQQTVAATGGANQSSNVEHIQGTYWNGSASATDDWTLQNQLGTGTNPTSTLLFNHSGSAGLTSVSFGSNPVTAIMATAGNAAIKYFTNDHVVYLSTGGNDSSDGLSPGAAKLTAQAAFNAATANGANAGTVIAAPGSYTGPTTWYSNLAVISSGPLFGSSFSANFGAAASSGGVIFTYAANLTLTLLVNLYLQGITLAFGNSGGGLILNSLASCRFLSVLVNQAGSNTQDAVQMKTNATTGAGNNCAFNVFNDFAIICNNAGVGTQSNGLSLTGSGAVNSGTFVTDNRFYNLTIAGGIKNGIKFELNSDSNNFYGVQLNNDGTAQGDVLVFNGNTPASTQDVANEVLLGVVSTGTFNHAVSVGTADSLYIQMSSAAEIAPNVLGGSATYMIETIGLTGVPPVLNNNGGKIKGSLLQGIGSGLGTGAPLQSIGTSTAAISFNAASGAADQKWWDILNSSTMLQVRAVKDDNSTAANAITVNRGAGASIGSIVFGSSGNSQTLFASTDTVVGKATTDVLTNKTLTSPVINGSPTGTGISTITLKKGNGGGNYSSASTSDVAVDGTNLALTVTIPTGWKLAIASSGAITSLTAIATVFVGLADGGVTVNTIPIVPTVATQFLPFSLNWVINGDGASHTVDLRYHTTNGADAVSINNASSTQLATMVFTLMPSN